MNEFYSSNELMVCKYCGNNIPIRARYCTYCNHQLNQDYLVKNEFVNNKQDMPYHSHSQNQPYSTNHQNIPINPYATNNRNVVNNPSVPNNQYSANNAQQTNQSRYHNPGFTQMNNIHSAQPHLQGANVAANFSSAITHCPNCNNLINPGSNYCSQCGYVFNHQAQSVQMHQNGESTNGMKALYNKANKYVGGDGVELSLKDLFSEVFHKHSQVEQDELFIYGTEHTTPLESQFSSTWPKPWLYSRVLAFFAIVFAILYAIWLIFKNTNVLPGLMFIGALAVPFATIIFFYECNAPRNISIVETVKLFFMGGTLSLIVTLFLFEFFPEGNLDYLEAIVIGIVEELGKLLIVAYYCKKLNPKYILNGLLIGSAVGGGFAVFETAGYAFNAEGDMIHVILIRALLAIGGHVVWAAIAGAALVAVKQDKPFSVKMLFNIHFLKIFVIPIALHAVWDMPIEFIIFNYIFVVKTVLIILAWVVTLALISRGLKQISEISKKYSNSAVNVNNPMR